MAESSCQSQQGRYNMTHASDTTRASKWYAVELYLRLTGITVTQYEPSELFDTLLYTPESPLSAKQKERLETLIIQLQEAQANQDCPRVVAGGPGACVRVLKCLEDEFNDRIEQLFNALCEPIRYKHGVLEEIERYQVQFARRIASLAVDAESCTASVPFNEVLYESQFSGHK